MSCAGLVTPKQTGRFFQIFVAFSEYLTFIKPKQSTGSWMEGQRNGLGYSVVLAPTVQDQHPVFGFSINSNEGNFRGFTIAYGIRIK
jgi:hypothetical protein